jgi:hypothetical protein
MVSSGKLYAPSMASDGLFREKPLQQCFCLRVVRKSVNGDGESGVGKNLYWIARFQIALAMRR